MFKLTSQNVRERKGMENESGREREGGKREDEEHN